MKQTLCRALALAILVWGMPATGHAAAPDYRLSRSVALGSPDRWDYVVFDSASHRVFVAHGDRITVVDGHDGTVLGNVEGVSSATHGIGISVPAGRGYTDDSEAGTAGAFDLKTLRPGARIPVAEDADAIAVDPASGHVFVIDGDSGKITVIDPVTNAVVATLDGGGKLEYAVADGKGKLFVNGAGKREMLRIDTAANRIEARWPVPDCASPHGLDMDRQTHRLFISCVNAVLTVLDSDDGGIVATLPIGKGTDAAVFDPVRKLVFSSNGVDGTLSVIEERDAQHFAAVATIETAVTGRTMAIDPATGRIYVAAADAEPGTPPGTRPKPVPGSLKLLFFDPVP
jgi:YVTN family beta-propeller protein